MIGYTPGPWRVYGTITRNRHCISGGRRFAVPVATTDGGENATANARLIAAAPDLLAALERIDAVCAPGESDPERMAAMLGEISTLAAAAIAMARGVSSKPIAAAA